MPKNFAIIGAGFSGLAVCWHLKKEFPSANITVFDRIGVGGGASGIAAGLLHTYAGAQARYNRDGKEGLAATLELVEVAGQSVIESRKLLRLAFTSQQREDFANCASRYDDVSWLSREECQQIYPNLASVPGILIENAYTINGAKYLNGLWLACYDKGARLIQEQIHSLKELEVTFDLVIVATGATSSFPELASIPLRKIKGQILEISWPNSLQPLPFALSSKAYVVMSPSKKSCFVGATFERNFSFEEPDIEIAKQELFSKVAELIPALKESHVISCRSGIRSSTPNHLPIVKRLSEKSWFIGGMGSKGLLYHALYAKRFMQNFGFLLGSF